ncbi:MAG: hypothetical protein ACP5TK_01890 [Candidatus Micrarchaeia archaeon]
MAGDGEYTKEHTHEYMSKNAEGRLREEKDAKGENRKNLYMFLLLVAAALVLTVVFRIAMLKYFGFYEPDGYYHFSVIRYAVEHNFTVPKYLSISGWPHSTPVTEPQGLYWVTLFPYAILRYAGISYYTVMRLIPVLFGLLDVIGAYYLARFLTKSKVFGVLVMLFVALSMGDAARTSALVYRGDGFVTIFLILSLIFLIEMLKTESKRRRIIYMALSGFVLSIGNYVWGGAPFATAIYVISFTFIVAYYFIFDKLKGLENSGYMLGALGIWYVLASIYRHIGVIHAETFTGKYFIMLYIFMAIGWYLALYISKRKNIFGSKTPLGRAITVIVFAIAIVVVMYLFTPAFIYQIFVGNGFITTTAFAQTIEELQPPSGGFLFSSFGFELLLSPLNMLLLLSAVIPHITLISWLIMFIIMPVYLFMNIDEEKKEHERGRAILKFRGSEAMLVVLAYFLGTAYLQMHAVRFNSLISVPLAIIAAYTLYWMINYSKDTARKIKKNSAFVVIAAIFAVLVAAGLKAHFAAVNKLGFGPIMYVIVAAYIIMGIYVYLRKEGMGGELDLSWLTNLFFAYTVSIVIGVVAYLALADAYVSQITSVLVGIFFAACGFLLALSYVKEKNNTTVLLASAAFVILYVVPQAYLMYMAKNVSYIYGNFAWMLSALVILFLAALYFYSKKKELWYVMPVMLIIFAIIFYDILSTASISPADSINPQFISALQWLKAHSPANSVVLTLWPDGSVVEGVANRTSVMDSVGAQNASKADPFAAWLLNSSDDPYFLTGNVMGKPNYLLVRYPWLLETSGIFTEANLPTGLQSEYGAAAFSDISEAESAANRTITITMENPSTNPPLLARVVVKSGNLTQNSISAYQLVPIKNTTSYGISPFTYVEFYNVYNTSYYVVKQTAFNQTNGQLLLLMFSPVPKPGVPVNLTQALVFDPGLAASNMYKFLYMCSATECAWNNNVAGLDLVYANSDTKIFRIVYNSTAAGTAG